MQHSSGHAPGSAAKRFTKSVQLQEGNYQAVLTR